MARLAILNDTGDTVDQIVVGELSDFPGSIDVTGQKVSKGWSYDGSTFLEPITPPDTQPVLNVSLAASQTPINISVGWTADVRLPDNSLAPINATYYVPVIRQDGWQIDLLEITFTGGEANGTISIDTPGIYTIDLAKVRPMPQSRLSDSPEIIVSKT